MKYYVVEILNQGKITCEDDYLREFNSLEDAIIYARRMKNNSNVIEIRQHIDDNIDDDYNTFDF